MVQVGYNAQHKVPWHWPVPAYLVTKGIGSGMFMLMSLGLGLGWFTSDGLTNVLVGFFSMLFIAITTALLIFDLEQPGRFYYMLIRPQWRSWLTRGAFILIGFTLIGGLWFLIEAGAYFEMGSGAVANATRPFFLWLGLPFALMSAIYTAFLFAQAEGRDLWQSPLLPFHLVVQSFMVGSAGMLVLNMFAQISPSAVAVSRYVFVAALIIDLFVTFAGEFGIPHASETAARAAHDITHGNYKEYFWHGSIMIGHIVPLVMILLGTAFGQLSTLTGVMAALCSIGGLYAYEYAFVMAPQDIPNS